MGKRAGGTGHHLARRKSAPTARSITAATAIYTAGADSNTTTETDDVMPPIPAPSPAYFATVRPFPLHHPSMRRVRLSGRQADALACLTAVPLVIDGASGVLPCAQAETALTDATTAALGRETCAVLHRWSYGGELWVHCGGGGFVQVANIELTPARQQAEVAA